MDGLICQLCGVRDDSVVSVDVCEPGGLLGALCVGCRRGYVQLRLGVALGAAGVTGDDLAGMRADL